MKHQLTALLTLEQYAGPDLPNRNFVQFGDKPLFEVIVDKLWRAKSIAHIVLVTDSEQVRAAYRDNASITLINLPVLSAEERANGISPASDRVTAHALEKVPGEHFIQLSSIYPFLTYQTVEEAAHLYDRYVLEPEQPESDFDSVMSLTRITKKRCYLSDEDPQVQQLQEDPPFVIVEDTALHIFSRTAFRRNGNRKLGTRPVLFETPEIENLSMETENTSVVARLVYENRRQFDRIFDRTPYLPEL
jgi:CMP-N-acetylneuraminic acid synthetase